MNVLPVPFTVLAYFGLWRPSDWEKKWKRNLYHLLTALVFCSIFTFVFPQLIQVIIDLAKRERISETLYILLTSSSALYKVLAFFKRNRDVNSLGNMLLNDRCLPTSYKEKLIQKKYDNVNRYFTVIYLALAYVDILLMVVAPFFKESNQRKLPFKTWLPYNIQQSQNFWLSYAHQILGSIVCASTNIAIDNVVTGFMLQACAQFDILGHRFKSLPVYLTKLRTMKLHKKADQLERSMFIDYMKHHDYIYLYAKKLNGIFNSIIFVQFCASATVITISVFQLSLMKPTSFDFLKVLLYLIVLLIEFKIYCWFGNEVNLKSIEFAENVYHSNWISLNLQSWKMMLFLIHRSSKPIFISSYSLVFLSLNTFVQILKVSYSAYNILKNGNVH